jgi:hypothetical protein
LVTLSDLSDEDFEQRLRRALQARAGDVRPDPALWARVRDRAERRGRPRWAAAAAAITPVLVIALAVAVLPGPGPDDDDDVTLQAGPSSTPSPSETLAGAPAGMVLATDPGIVLADATGEALATLYRDRATRECSPGGDCEAEVVTSVRVRPGTASQDAAVAFSESFYETCGDVGVAGSGTPPYLAARTADAAGACDSAPVWSPDGLFVAFLRPVGDGFRLAYMAWNRVAGAPYGGDHVTVEVDGGEGLSQVRLHDWVWTEGPGETPSGMLVLTARDPDGVVSAYRLPVSRPVRDEFDLVPTGPIAPLPGGRGVLAYADGADARVSSEGPAYTIAGNASSVYLSSPGGDLPLPSEVLDPSAPDGDRVWLVERGGVLLFGDGVDDAWRVVARGAGRWGQIERLPGDIRSGDLLSPTDAPAASEAPLASPTPSPSPPWQEPRGRPAPTPTTSPSASPRPSPSPSPAPSPSALGPGAAVLETRDALLAAAAARSYDQLEALLPSDGEFTSSFGGETDHIAYYQRQEVNGVDIFGELAAALNQQPQDQGPGPWVWGPLEELGWRAGIEDDGTWRFFVAGD